MNFLVSMLQSTVIVPLTLLPIVRTGGGMLVAATGWRMLQTDGDDEVRSAVADHAIELSRVELARRSFFPMSFPLTAGPGAIATSIALGTTTTGSNSTAAYLSGLVVALVGTVLTAGAVYASYRYGTELLAAR